jgi:DNA-binding CsgD family transcriptional regulator
MATQFRKTTISNEQELVQLLWGQGHSEEKIAAIVCVDVMTVHGYLEEDKEE